MVSHLAPSVEGSDLEISSQSHAVQLKSMILIGHVLILLAFSRVLQATSPLIGNPERNIHGPNIGTGSCVTHPVSYVLNP